mgnify:CR=1 FL=1
MPKGDRNLSALKQLFDSLLGPDSLANKFEFTGKPDYSITFVICLTDTGEVWRARIENDHLTSAEPLPENSGELGFVMESGTFAEISSGSITVQKVFLSRRVEIQGGLFKGMILAQQLGAFFKKFADHIETVEEPVVQFGFEEEALVIELDDGCRISAVLGYDDNTAPDSVLFIFPPHPMLGGDFENNVVNQLYTTAVNTGQLAVKFNYRMVGSAETDDDEMLRYWRDLEETSNFDRIVGDVQEMIWQVMENIGENLKIDFAAYSFGNLIALQAMRHIAVRKYVGISPPLMEYDFESLFAEFPGMNFVISEHDSFCPEAKFTLMADKYGLKLHKVNSDDHFYRGSEKELNQQYLKIMMVI